MGIYVQSRFDLTCFFLLHASYVKDENRNALNGHFAVQLKLSDDVLFLFSLFSLIGLWKKEKETKEPSHLRDCRQTLPGGVLIVHMAPARSQSPPSP